MRGLTLIEILIVLSLFTVLIGISIGPGLQDFQNMLAQSDGTRMAALARHARAEAMHGTAHSLFWAATSSMLTIRSSTDESYSLAGNETGTLSTAIQFLGPESLQSAGSLLLRSSRSTWEIDTDTAGAITLLHSL